MFRLFLWMLVALAAGITTWLAIGRDSPLKSGGPRAPEFSLQKAGGGTITDQDMLGNPHLVFFGFTNCPEICPTTLYEAQGWVEQLGDKAKDLKIYFVSVDPEHDTPELLGNYLSPFAGTVTGITGDLAEIDKLAKSFHVFYRKVPLDEGGYTVDHTASVFLMHADGSFSGTISWGENTEIAIGKIARLLEGQN